MDGDLGWHYGGNTYNNWDLNAVVRLGGGGVHALAPVHDDPFFAALPPPQQDELFHAAGPWQEAQELPAVAEPAIADMGAFLSEGLFAAPQPLPPASPWNEAPPAPQQGPDAMEMEPPAVDNRQPEQQSSGVGSNQPRQMSWIGRDMQKKWVISVPSALGPVADLWAWRKYGQKPIKGSPYPRSYYKCSSDKKCQARKQVERRVADPSFVVITYTGYHCHPVPANRSPIAGTTRLRRDAPGPSSSQAAAAPEPLVVPAAPTPPSTVYDVEFDEEDDDGLALKALIESAAMAPEDAFLFLDPVDNVAPAPVTGGGGEGRNQLFSIPENMAIDASRGGMASGGAPIPNVVMDTPFVAPWEGAGPVAADWWGM